LLSFYSTFLSMEFLGLSLVSLACLSLLYQLWLASLWLALMELARVVGLAGSTQRDPPQSEASKACMSRSVPAQEAPPYSICQYISTLATPLSHGKDQASPPDQDWLWVRDLC
jgi:hypothetical protein